MRWSEGNASNVAGFGDALRQAGYTESGLRHAIGASSSLAHDPHAREVARRRVATPSLLHTLIKLFCLGVAVPAHEIARGLGPTALDDLIGMQMVGKPEGGSIVPAVAIDAAGDLLIAHDPPGPGSLPGDHVIGLGPAPRTLAALTVRATTERVLDLGTGSGIQALLALRHAREVVATDINPRALAYTQFNAALNGLAMPATRHGDLFEPVAEETFDLIVANPPYVLSPESSLQFRDGGMVGDELSRTVVRAAARHLDESGFASILVTWAHRPEEAWAAPLVGWVRGTGCDALLLRFRTYDPVTYASLWIKDDVTFGTTLDRWLAYYQESGIRAMSSGAVILRRRSGVNWWRATEVWAAPIPDASDHLRRIFDAGDRLAHGSDAELLEQRFLPHPGHRIHRTGVSSGGSYLVDGQSLETVAGIPLRISMGEVGSRLLAQLDGTRSLASIISEVSARMRGMASDEVRRIALQTVKQLFGLGFLGIPAQVVAGQVILGVTPAEQNERSLVTP